MVKCMFGAVLSETIIMVSDNPMPNMDLTNMFFVFFSVYKMYDGLGFVVLWIVVAVLPNLMDTCDKLTLILGVD